MLYKSKYLFMNGISVLIINKLPFIRFALNSKILRYMSKSVTPKIKKEDLVINRIAVVLKEERKSSNWLAKEIGFTISTLSRYITNKTQPNLYVLYMISLVLDRNIQDLLSSSKDVSQEDKATQLKLLRELAAKSKRTGKRKK